MAVLNSKPRKRAQQSSWDQIKSLVTCKPIIENSSSKNPYHLCSKICTFRDVVHGNTRIVDRAAGKSPEHAAAVIKKGRGPSGGGVQLRKLSGCYECHAVVDLRRHPLPRSSNIFPCSQCGEVFPKIESLELHRAVRHAVSQLGPDDTSRNIVEIIFKSSWLKKENPVCEIDRILKVHNTQRTIQRFEDHRAAVKLRAKRNARCAADGNELLRFHAAAITCNLGAHGSSSLCGSVPACGICTIIRHGFKTIKTSGGAICTTASSGRADDCLSSGGGPHRAALVCRVIAGRVKAPQVAEDATTAEVLAGGLYDSLAGSAGAYSNNNMEELHVFSSRAILPCFVVIYKVLQ